MSKTAQCTCYNKKRKGGFIFSLLGSLLGAAGSAVSLASSSSSSSTPAKAIPVVKAPVNYGYDASKQGIPALLDDNRDDPCFADEHFVQVDNNTGAVINLRFYYSPRFTGGTRWKAAAGPIPVRPGRHLIVRPKRQIGSDRAVGVAKSTKFLKTTLDHHDITPLSRDSMCNVNQFGFFEIGGCRHLLLQPCR